MKYAQSVLDLVGNTPLVKLQRVVDDVKATVLVKVEYMNPGGSVKDRIAINMIDAAEKDGLLKPGGTIVEPTSGNTGVGLALVGALRGYKCIFTMPDKVSKEKQDTLRAYGAEVVVCPTAVEPESPESYYSVAQRLSEEIPGAFRPNQYANPNNPRTHYLTTGPEIWEQTDGKVTVFVAGMGTGGTISGIGQYLKEKNPAIQIVGADPEGSIYSSTNIHTYLVEGIGEDFFPSALDMSVIDSIVQTHDKESLLMTRRLAVEEGLLVGGSCGAAVVAGLRYAREHNLGSESVMVIILPDSGKGYLSKVFSDTWMRQHQMLDD